MAKIQLQIRLLACVLTTSIKLLVLLHAPNENISKEEFNKNIDQMLEYTEFNGWFYGTSRAGLDESKINICVLNIAGAQKISTIEDIKLLPIFLSVTSEVSLLRQLSREENPNVKEILRRYYADNKDFDFEIDPLPNIETMTVWNMWPGDADTIANYIVKYGQEYLIKDA